MATPSRLDNAADFAPLRRVRIVLRKACAAEPLEFAQIKIRYAAGLAMTGCLAVAHAGPGPEGRSVGIIAAAIIGAWCVVNGGLIHFLLRPARRTGRRIVLMLTDAVVLGLFLHAGGKSAAILSPLYLWAALGNGLGFGRHGRNAVIAANLAAFAAMVLTTPAWREALPFAAAMGLAIVIIPLSVARLIADLRQAVVTAESSNQAKTQFIAMISHELRTPLNAILGLAQLSKITASNAKERLSAVSTELAAGRLIRMVDTILKFQRIESGTAGRSDRDFDLLDSLNEVRAIIEPLAEQKDLAFRLRFASGVPERLRSDPDHIQTIILNLLANAVKYTNHGEVSLDIGLLGDAMTRRLRIAVRDTGDGIAPKMQSRIFDRYVRGDDQAAASESGVGLGLSVCKSLVELLGGVIGCESRVGEGSLFWAELPVMTAERGAVDDRSSAVSQEATAPVIWIGAGARPPAAALISKTAETPEALRGMAKAAGSLWAYVLAVRPDRISPEMRSAILATLKAERRPALILIGAKKPDTDALGRLADAAIGDVADPEAAALIATIARWHRRIAQPAVEVAPDIAAAGRRHTILVADDNALNREVTRRMLELDGHKVNLAETGDAALRSLSDGAVEAAFLDINMPGLSGIDVCRTYKSGQSGGSIPLIGVTADISQETRASCLAAGMVEVLGKPVTIEQLRRALTDYLRPCAPPAAPAMPTSEAQTDNDPVADQQRIQLLWDLFGKDKLQSQFLPSFRRDLTSSLHGLRDALDERDVGLIRDALHALKSSASSAGAKEILAIIAGFPIANPKPNLAAFEVEIEAAYQRYCERVGGEAEALATQQPTLSSAVSRQ